MNTLSLKKINFHDALLLNFVYLHNEKRIEMVITSFLEVGKEATEVKLDFRKVSFLLCTNAQPWGPSQYINSATLIDHSPCDLWEVQPDDNMLHFQTQSGDDIFISYNQVVID